jgi:hypothetical protein
MIRGGIAMHEIKRVESPIHQDMDEIAKAYWDNWLLISNLTDNPRGGTVQYYCYVRDKKLWELIMEMDKDFNTYGDCTLRFVGPSRADSLGGLGL